MKTFTENDLKLLMSTFSFYRKNYNIETDDGWSKVDYYLTDNQLLKSINNVRSDVAIFSCYKANFFVCDIDNHSGKVDVKNIYYKIYNKIGQPSLVCKSPRGLHVYYLLTDYYDASLLTKKISQLLNLKNVDIKPSYNSAIRSINSNYILSPTSLHKSRKKFCNYIKESVKYSSSEILFDYIEPIKKPLCKSSGPIGIIYKGQTNDALNTLIPIWKTKGFTNEQCVEMFQEKLDKSYSGECRSKARLLKRIQYYTGGLETKKIVSSSLEFVEDTYSKLIEFILNKYDKFYKNKTLYNRTRFKSKLKEFIIAILYAKQTNKSIYDDPQSRSLYDQLYCFFSKEVRNGNTPLPSTFFKAISTNYHQYTNFLHLIGFISMPNGRSYDTQRNSCIYYKVNTTLHIKDQFNELNNYLHKCIVFPVKEYVVDVCKFIEEVGLKFRSFNQLSSICSNMFLDEVENEIGDEWSPSSLAQLALNTG